MTCTMFVRVRGAVGAGLACPEIILRYVPLVSRELAGPTRTNKSV
jgi:hypothetical protein